MPQATSYWKKRSYVGQRGLEGQTWGCDDAVDNWAYLDSAQGKDATVRSPTYFWDNTIRFSRPTDLLYSYNIRTSSISHDVDVYYPVVPADILTDYFLLRDTPAEIKNKIITPQTNTLSGVEKFPDYAKSGKFQGSTLRGEGIMDSLIHLDPPQLLGDPEEGSYARYTTPTSANSQTGNWVDNSYLTMGKFDPIFKLKLRVPDWAINTNRLFVGLVSANSVLQNDVPFGLGDAALMMGYRNGDSDFKLFRGVGNGVTTVAPTATNVNLRPTVIELEFGFKNTGTIVYYKIDNGQEVTFSTNIPNPERWLRLHVCIQNTTGADRDLDIFYERIETRK